MHRTRVSQFRFGSAAACLALAGACAQAPSSTFSGGDDGGGNSTLSGSSGSSGSSSSSSSSGGAASSGGTAPETDNGDAAPATGTSNGTQGAGSGSGSGGTGAPASSGAGDAAASCTATMAAGAIALSENFLEPKVLGDGGYAYSYSDAAKGGTSSVCLDALALCGAGSTGAMSTATWGAGIGVNLNQAMGMSPPMQNYAVTGSGISYTLSNLPSQGASLIIDNGGMDYCAELSSATGTINWSAFNLTCWAPTPAGDLSGAPTTATHVNFQVNAAAAAAPFDFCVTAASFAP
jgi:hypothetical protein